MQILVFVFVFLGGSFRWVYRFEALPQCQMRISSLDFWFEHIRAAMPPVQPPPTSTANWVKGHYKAA